jgi:adenylate cyclase
LPVACVGGAWFAAALLVWTSDVFDLRENARELVFDQVLPRLASRAAQSPVVVVDIDSESLARYGPWPWRRLMLAELLQKIARSKPRAVGLDILLAEPDRLSPAGFMRSLGAAGNRDDIAELASKLPDGDVAVAAAIAGAPAVLGFALDPVTPAPPPPGAGFLFRGRIDVPDIWQAAGAVGPLPTIAAAARGVGALALAGDADGAVRRVPLLVVADGDIRPGFAADLLRASYSASSFILETTPQQLHIGPIAVPIDADAALRILPRPVAAWPARTIPAWQILDDETARMRLAGQIVLVGSGAPEVGGLRPTPASSTTPSVQIQADAVETLASGIFPRRPPWVSAAETSAAVLLAVAAMALALFRAPIAATGMVGLLCLGWEAVAVAAFLWNRLLLDMVGPPVVAVAAFTATALANYAHNERRARALRRRFEQHLAPDVVRQLLNAPRALRLGGESREVTAMFTDIEGFTTLTERSDAGDVVRLLDGYVAAITGIVVAHGGMVDKLIGDGIFALFNVPLDLADHARHAVAAAKAIVAATETYRQTPLAAKLGLGRTRVGIESGTAIVGDVGGGGKLDYTALGNVVNTASRLEGMNKELKTSICIGPAAAAKLAAAETESLGVVKVRGRGGEIEVFTVSGGRVQQTPPARAAE